MMLAGREGKPNVCAWCASIQWRLLSLSVQVQHAVPVEFANKLDNSNCRLCHLLRKIDIIHGLSRNKHERLTFCRSNQNFAHLPGIDAVSFRRPSSNGLTGIAREPHLIISGLPTEKVQSAFSHLYPDSLDFEQMRGWIEDCNSWHGHVCMPARQDHLQGMKLINCKTFEVVPAPMYCLYVALSYVWGVDHRPMPGDRLLRSELPRTIDDAVSVTLSLGYNYLWVDQYCIDQSDDEDKQLQIGQMGEIYSAADLTIVATAGESSAHGLPGVRAGSRGVVKHCEIVDDTLLLPFLSGSDIFEIERSKWASRAWTLQECFLPKRRLIFTSREVIFICNTVVRFETKDAGNIRAGSSQPRTGTWIPELRRLIQSDMIYGTAGFFYHAMRVLKVYSARDLSFDSDALNAVVGALNVLAREGFQHFWGVPYLPATFTDTTAEDLHKEAFSTCNLKSKSGLALLWYHEKPCCRRSGFPSWSPLGWVGQIDWYNWQTYRDMGHYLTFDAKDMTINTATATQPLSSAVIQTESRTSNTSHLLGLKILATDLRITIFTSDVSVQSRIGVAMAVNNDLDAVFRPHWDISPSELATTAPLRGILLRGNNTTFPPTQRDFAVVIILAQQKLHYERVGSFELPWDLRKKHTISWVHRKDVAPVAEEELMAVAVAQPDFDRARRSWLELISGRPQRSSVYTEEKPWRYWWAGCFTEEIIVVG